MSEKEDRVARSLANERRAYIEGERFYKQLEETYQKAQQQISADIKKFIERYSRENEISLAQAQKRLSQAETAEYKEDIAKILEEDGKLDPKLEKELTNRYIMQKITRLQALKNQIDLRIKALGAAQEAETFEHLKSTYSESYYQSVLDLAKSGIAADFDILNDPLVEQIVKTKWLHESFDERIWKHNDKLIEEVRDILSVAAATKTININTMSRKLAKRMDVSKTAARRLIRTETNYVLNQATLKSYIDAGLEKYQFVAVLDARTSQICFDMDGEIIPVSEAVPGRNYPPKHPNCRSTTVAYFDEDADEYEAENDGMRQAKDKAGNSVMIPKDMTYKEFYDRYIKGKKPGSRILTDSATGGKVGDTDGNTVINAVSRIDITDDNAVMREIDSFCSRCKEAKEEHALVIARSGSVYELTGSATVDPLLAGTSELIGAIIAHNHPVLTGYDRGDSFSRNDLMFAAEYETGLQYVVSGEHRDAFLYTGHLTKDELYEAWGKAYLDVLEDVINSDTDVEWMQADIMRKLSETLEGLIFYENI